MSDLPNSVTYLTQATRNGLHERESFRKFFECWIAEQNQHLEELVSAAKDHDERPIAEQNQHLEELVSAAKDHDERPQQDQRVLDPLIRRVIEHYEHYYRAKSRWARTDVLSMFNPSWRSSLEDAFLWIGGWRPTMAFHLLYSESGLQLEARIEELLRGISKGDLADLSPKQLEQVDELQRRTIREEKEVTEKLARQQETVADSTMVELAHAATEMMREGEAMGEGRVESALAEKEKGMAEILQMADDLRLKTLKEVLRILGPMQAVHFLIAAAALHLRVHEWGMKRDHQAANNR